MNIEFLGKTSSSGISELMCKTSFFIHTSYIENSPNSVCEAQILGVPVIATNVGGISSLITNNVTGILVPANDPFYLAPQIIELYNNKDKSKRLGEKGRLEAQLRHDKTTIINDLISIYKKIKTSN